MAHKITLTSGSVLNGNPITLTINSDAVTRTDDDGNTVYPSFHRVILNITCGMSGGNFETINMSSPVEEESNTSKVKVDISSALRTFRDSYEYSALPTTYPIVKFTIKAYDEYMLDGEVNRVGIVYFPGKTTYLCTLFGAFSDLDRLTSNGTKGLKVLTRKPTSTPQIVAVGETLAYTPAYSTEQSLADSADLTAPTSKVADVTKEGLQTLGYQSIYALPATEAEKRQQFRFINQYGVLESVSVPGSYSRKVSVTSTSYNIARQETFNSFSRSIVEKQNNRESWLCTTDPLDENWLEWYTHEFLMAKHIWIFINGNWLPCTITPEDDITLIDRTSGNMYTLSFTAQLGINGSPML